MPGQGVGVVHLHAHLNGGVLLADGGQQRAEQRGRRVGADPQRQVAHQALAVLADVAHQAAGFEQQFVRSLQHKAAGIGGRGLARAAVKQAQAQLLFGGLDAAAKGRLGQVAVLCGAAEIAPFGQGDQVAQATEVHGRSVLLL